MQEAADLALAGVDQPAAIVALDAPTGEVRAVAARPLDQPFNRALDGQYPPGSSFKVVTAEALVGGGLRPEATVSCEPMASIGGKPFKNFEDESFGSIPFRDAFAHSCNTAFVTLADDKLSDADLVAAAGRFGFGVDYDAGVERMAASSPTRTTPPTGPPPPSARDGCWPAPSTWPRWRRRSRRGRGGRPASPARRDRVARPPQPGDRGRPRRPHAGGGAHRHGHVGRRRRPGVAGKTGTAEFGNADPPATHAWFIGFRGPLAFAVLVEGGGVGGRVAAPIAARFLAAAPG